MNSIKDQLQSLLEKIPDDCTLVAVSKTKPISAIQEAYDAGHRHFGENKVQELTGKYDDLPKDICWHMIGHLQRNKVKYIAPFVHLIHGVDTVKLLREINKEAIKNERVIDCLLQVHIASEETKFGFSKDELIELFDSEELNQFDNVRITGLMGMATNTNDVSVVVDEFNGLKELYLRLKENFTHSNVTIKTLSMGMSGDYEIAIQQGSNMIRVGSAIFGARNY